jgi:hypothetical protein
LFFGSLDPWIPGRIQFKNLKGIKMFLFDYDFDFIYSILDDISHFLDMMIHHETMIQDKIKPNIQGYRVYLDNTKFRIIKNNRFKKPEIIRMYNK